MNFESNRGNVCISIPWRDRAWILPYTLESIVNSDYPKEKIGMRFIVNDSKDDTFRMLMQFKDDYRNKYRFISIWTFNMGSVKDNRTYDVRKKTIYNMQVLKNVLVDALSKRDEYWFYMDSDICLKPDTLKLLVEADKSAIAGLCKTGEGDIYNFLMYESHMNRFGRGFDAKKILASKDPVKVDLIAGILLFRYEVAKKIRFYQSSVANLTEDEGATRDMMHHKIERWIHPGACCYHIMDDKQLDDYKKKTGLNGLDIKVTHKRKYEEVIEDNPIPIEEAV
jgi:cellulose synthase/poly-beta-1,6-N-acetylglucosamine synthase-like glycosyltransferase